MKNFRKILGIAVVLSLFSFSAEAQFGNVLKRAAKRGAERAAEKQVEKQTEKIVNRELEKQFVKIFGEYDESQSVGIDMSSVFASMGQNVDTEDQYSFSGNIIMEMKTTNEKGKAEDPMKVKSYLGNSTDYSGMEVIDANNKKGEMGIMIFDMKNDASIILMESEGEKSSMSFKLNAATIEAYTDQALEEQENDESYSFTKTGKTKNILGYSCDEYHVTSSEGEGYYWVTTETIGGYTSFWATNSPLIKGKAKDRYAEQFKSLPQGNFMEMIYKDNDGTTVEMTVLEINESAPVTFLMSEYPNVMAQMQTEN